MNKIQGFNRNPEVTQELLDRNNLCAGTNNTTILNFSDQKIENILFVRGLDQRAINELKHKTRSWFAVITITILVRVSVLDQWIGASTILDTKIRGTLHIVGNVFFILPMTFSRILHEEGHQTDCKQDIWWTMNEIN